MNQKKSDIIQEKLINYLQKLYDGESRKKNYENISDILLTVRPKEVNNVLHDFLSQKQNSIEIQDLRLQEKAVAKFIRACGKGLDSVVHKSLPEDHFISLLEKENLVLELKKTDLTHAFKTFVAENRNDNEDRKELLRQLKEISEIKSHYLKLQYSLFPAYEKYVTHPMCTHLMWYIQDEVMTDLKSLILFLEGRQSVEFSDFNQHFGNFFMRLGTLLYRERKILYPVALDEIPELKFKAMYRDVAEHGLSFGITMPDSDLMNILGTEEYSDNSGDKINLSVGKLLPTQIDLMLKTLPLDLTFVDENDKVRYYSQGKERIFPRSPGIIGREVSNCHPPKSLHVVSKIINDFKEKKRSEASFHIKIGEKFIHIQYFALYEAGNYKGVLEVSQNIAPLQALEGEKRLLDED